MQLADLVLPRDETESVGQGDRLACDAYVSKPCSDRGRDEQVGTAGAVIAGEIRRLGTYGSNASSRSLLASEPGSRLTRRSPSSSA